MNAYQDRQAAHTVPNGRRSGAALEDTPLLDSSQLFESPSRQPSRAACASVIGPHGTKAIPSSIQLSPVPLVSSMLIVLAAGWLRRFDGGGYLLGPLTFLLPSSGSP
jgi:hypothetical protein